MSNIKISPSEVRSISKTYHQSSQEITAMLSNLKGAQDKLQGVWEGDAFDAFTEQFNVLKPKVTDFSELLEDIYNQLNKIAQIIEETDDQIGKVVRKGF